MNYDRFLQLMTVSAVLTYVGYFLGMIAGWITELSWLEIGAVFLNFWCVLMCIFQMRVNYIVGTIACAMLALLFYNLGLYASALLQLYFVPWQIYGWYRWGKDEETRPVTTVSWPYYGVYAVISFAAYVSAYVLADYSNAELPATDVAIFVLSILAQTLMDNKKLESWAIWSLVNVFAVYTYTQGGAYLVAFQYSLFLLNSFYGFYKWSQTR